jgi:predicted ATPase/DNA-binding CsgD family transcriptional regulator
MTERIAGQSIGNWQTTRHNLPAQLTTLIGREREVAVVRALLQRPEVRLVTLTGTGGVGKTRLGLQVAAEVLDEFTEGVFFVSLAPLSDPSLVVPTIAEALGIREIGDRILLDLLKAYLQEKCLLLLLDNFEQVLAASIQVADLLAACPQLKVVVTSRAVLHVRGEQEFAVPPLAVPDPKHLPELEALSQYEAVALFLQRAQAAMLDFHMDDANVAAIAEICIRLDGLPLAIELAAVRIKLLPLQALLTRLEHRLHVLTGGARDVPERQQTLRNTIAWSYHLLDTQEQRLFRRLSVFVGGCTLEAVEAVCYETRLESLSALDETASLLDKSLLQQVAQEGTARLMMLETICEYGLECLRESGEARQIQSAHAEYYLALVEEAEPYLKGAQQLLWLRRLDREQENLRAAVSWLITHEEGEKALRFCVALWWFWQTRGYWSEGRRWLKAALALPGAGERTAVRARALSAAGELAGIQTDWQEAQQLLSESRDLYNDLGDDRGYVLPLSILGWVTFRQGDLAASVPLMERCIILCRKLGSNWELSRVLLWLGNITYLQGDLEQAIALTQEGLTLTRELGDRTLINHALNNLGYFLYLQGDLVQATALTQEGLALAQELGDTFFILQMLDTLGSIALSNGDLEQAISCFTEGLSKAQEFGNERLVANSLSQDPGLRNDALIAWHLWGLARVPVVRNQLKRAARLFAAVEVTYDINRVMSPNERDDYERTIGSVRSRLREQAFAAAWAEGRIMSIEQILAEPEPVSMPESDPLVNALPIIDKPLPTQKHPDDLTAREVEVLHLVARGMTNEQVAEQLVISPRTVNSHLTSIYGKIGVSSRSAATRYAFEHHLV